MEKKREFGAADAYRVTVLQESAMDGDSVDEGSVVTLKVDEFVAAFLLVEGAVTIGDCGVSELQLIGVAAPDGKGIIGDRPDGFAGSV